MRKSSFNIGLLHPQNKNAAHKHSVTETWGGREQINVNNVFKNDGIY